jgi:hypothetical protein
MGVECSVLDIPFSFDHAKAWFDVQRSSFKTTLHGINVTCEESPAISVPILNTEYSSNRAQIGSPTL